MGPLRAELLRKELSLHSFGDLLNHFPLRHIDRTQVLPIGSIDPATDFVQVSGKLISLEVLGEKRQKRLIGKLRDQTGVLELVWFQGVTWMQKNLVVGQSYLVFGRAGFFNATAQIVHPELEVWTPARQEGRAFLEPVYPSTELLKTRGLGGRQIARLTENLFQQVREKDVTENLPARVLELMALMPRFRALQQIHFPSDPEAYQAAVRRIKFEEIFLAQMRMNLRRAARHRFSRAVIFSKVGDSFNTFYQHHLPFELTNAQKRVIREIRQDTGSGKQMNRLLQGDVGSGKTMVALLTMLLAVDNGFQACLMAPTEILARQHYTTISEQLKDLPVPVALLTGSTRTAARKKLLAELESGHLKILIGTHAVIEEAVKFQRLGIVIIDEQHRFGVAQRARLWEKAELPPHVLVMTATPIPRTLAMTAYGDLDYSVIDELPPGRQPVTTVHRLEKDRSRVMEFIKAEIALGRQAYIIFPLIEESARVDYEDLMRGYDTVKGYFPEPAYWISMVHGKMPAAQKEQNMQRFVEGDTQIMVSTTVIEVGVNVPNASVMVIENAEKFGLSQLHQLRGRVGRGADKSYCILLSSSKLGRDARERLKTMVSTSNGFEIAEKDLELRGPGDIEGTRQSGMIHFRLADIVQDKPLVEKAKQLVAGILEADPELGGEENAPLRMYLQSQRHQNSWSKIS